MKRTFVWVGDLFIAIFLTLFLWTYTGIVMFLLLPIAVGYDHFRMKWIVYQLHRRDFYSIPDEMKHKFWSKLWAHYIINWNNFKNSFKFPPAP